RDACRAGIGARGREGRRARRGSWATARRLRDRRRPGEVRAMRRARIVIVVGLALETTLLGARWWTGLAAAERMPGGAEPATPAPVAAELFAKSRGFRDLLQAIEQRGAELDRREQAVAAREAALKALEAALDEQVVQLERAAPAGPSSAATPEPAGCGVAVTK